MPQQKQTVLGLYVTAKEAYEMWQTDKNKIKILDVRTKDPSSSSYGKRSKNGWKNSGIPWTDKLNPELIWIPSNP